MHTVYIIALQVSGVTTDVELGLGSFIDKPIAPFSLEDFDGTPIVVTTRAPYSFRHIVNLTTNKMELAVSSRSNHATEYMMYV